MTPAARIEAIEQYLVSIIDSPDCYINNTIHMLNLRSQTNLAKAESEEHHLKPSSLNTLKEHANKVSRSQFRKLDDLRRVALAKLNNAVSSDIKLKKTGKKSLSRQIEELRANNTLLREDLMRLTNTIYETLTIARKYIALLDQATIRDNASKELATAINSSPKLKQQ